MDVLVYLLISFWYGVSAKTTGKTKTKTTGKTKTKTTGKTITIIIIM